MRCAWARTPAMVAYHDEEWGVPLHGERELFEFLVLEGAQAGLSWETILRKRDGYRAAFAGFDPDRVAEFGARDVTRLLADPAIVRNRSKIESAIANAAAVVALRASDGGFDAYLAPWRVAARKEHRRPRESGDVPAETPVSGALSRDLRAHGFRFVGPVVVYSFMQATGFVNDHVAECFRADKSGRRRL